MNSYFRKLKGYKLNAGMSYVELIVVLSIFSVISSIAVFNYWSFQAKVDIKNLANDIALKVVQAQKDSSFGKLPSVAHQLLLDPSLAWKPSYGLYFDLDADTQSFIYFTDLNNTTPPQNKLFDGSSCTIECMEEIDITGGNSISEIKVFFTGISGIPPSVQTKAQLSFTRPNSAPTVIVGADTTPLSLVDYVQISILSPQSNTAKIKIYASGRIQIN